MKTYNYIALNGCGKEAKGSLRAEDSTEALRRLKEMGVFPTKVGEVPTALDRPKHPTVAPGKDATWWQRDLLPTRVLPWRRERVRPKTLAVFTRQLATLLKAGMPLLRGLLLLEEQERNPVLRGVIQKLVTSIESGSSFTEALALSPKVFNPLYLSMAKAGELSGALDTVLDRLATFQEKAERIKGKVVAGTFYPAAVLMVAIAVMGLLMAFVVPKFKMVFDDLLSGRPLPVFTQIVFGVSQTVKDHFVLTLAGLAAIVFGFSLVAGTERGRRLVDRLKLRLPLLGPVFSKSAIARFSRTLGTLLSSGVPILQALTIVKETVGNVILGEAVALVRQSVKEGETIALPLRASGVFPSLVVGMVDIGEQTGALPDMLFKIADNYDDEVDNAVSAMTSLLEPIMIILLAILVGCIVVAMFLPIIGSFDDVPTDRSGGDGI